MEFFSVCIVTLVCHNCSLLRLYLTSGTSTYPELLPSEKTKKEPYKSEHILTIPLL